MDKQHYQELVEKYLDGNIADNQIKELADWIKNDLHLQVWWEQEFIKSDASIDVALRDKLFERIKKATLTVTAEKAISVIGKKKKRFRMDVWRWVAVVCLPICLSFFIYHLMNISMVSHAPVIVKADKGDKATIELPDGSQVILNSSSRLSYFTDFSSRERRVSLDGEAYFKVSRDLKHPFIVQAGGLEVKVLGTSFNVAAYQDDESITIVLLEGKVNVYAHELSRSMTPGDKIEYDKKSNKMFSTRVAPNDYIEWTKGNLYFEKESLKNIMMTLSRIYDVKIIFDSDQLSNERFTGTIPTGGIQNALNILMLVSHFSYETEGSTIVLKENK